MFVGFLPFQKLVSRFLLKTNKHNDIFILQKTNYYSDKKMNIGGILYVTSKYLDCIGDVMV